MELICPVCNGLEQPNIECPQCGDMMVDKGPIVDYLDDYSPYLSNDITQLVDGAPHDKCTHLYQCESCGIDKRIEISRIEK